MPRAFKIQTATTYRSDAVNAVLNELRTSKHEPMSATQEIEAFANRDANRDAIANANMRFVFSIAKMYAKGDDVLDYYNSGLIGLLTAIDRFEVERGFRFISFAIHYIRMEMSLLCKMSLIHRSNEQKIGSKVTKFQSKFLQENGREASDNEILDHLKEVHGIDIKYISEIHSVKMSSLSDVVGEDGTAEENGEVAMVSASYNEYENEMSKDDLKFRLDKVLNQMLTAREKSIVYAVVVDGKEMADVADDLGMTSERVRQIKVGALKKIAKSDKARAFLLG